MNNFFLVIGTYRAGTTWLYKILRQINEIDLPEEKEIFYFSRYYDRGQKWYQNFFSADKNKVTKGEICPSYLSHPEAPKRIFAFNKNTKLIVILREPISQIKSMLRMHYNHKKLDITKINKDLIERYYIENVKYFKHISNYLTYFSRDQLLILTFDELVSKPDELIQKILNFLELPGNYESIDTGKVNTANIPRIPFIEQLIISFGEFLRNKNLFFIKKMIQKIGLQSIIRGLNDSGKKSEISLDDEIINYIKKETSEDIYKLNREFNIHFGK